MKTKTGRILAVIVVALVTLLHASSHEYVSAAAWCSLGLAIALSGKKPDEGQKRPKTLRQYATLLFIIFALGLFSFQLYRDLTDHGASRIPSTTPVHE
ncbi:hypothetical protein [Rufibacter immobilis]|uniref:hypothetical protein n=1 Tax=Rufibacter immobilis TaxID=1348778 RepID=UPI0035E8B593